MRKQAHEYLKKRLEEHKYAWNHAVKRKDVEAADRIKEKIDVVEYLIALVKNEHTQKEG